MKHLKRLMVGCLLVLLPLAMVAAQDSTPPGGDTPTPLPAMPTAPYVKEHVEAITAHLQSARDDVTKARTLVEEKQTAANEADLSPEEKQRRDAELATAQEALQAAEARVEMLQGALASANAGPTADQLEARRHYTARYTLVELAQRELQPSVEKLDGQPEVQEGERARNLRLAEEEQSRIDQLAARGADFEFSKSRVYDKLSDIEKLEYEIRWATERFRLSIAAYDHLKDVLFAAYRDYEARAFEAVKAADEALELYEKFKGTPAESMELPNATRPPTALPGMKSAILAFYDARNNTNRRSSERLRLRAFEGRLEAMQQEIDLREDYLEKLQQDSEKIKTLLAGTANRTDAEGEEETPAASEDYQKLALRIDQLKEQLKDNANEIERLAEERQVLVNLVAEKQSIEVTVQETVSATEHHIRFIEQMFATTPVEEPLAPPPGLNIPAYSRRPSMTLFTLRERLKAENERLSAAKRDTRQEQTRLEILDRRVESISEQNTQIESELLPTSRNEYYEEIAVTVGIRALKVVGVFVLAWVMLFLIKRVSGPLIDRVVRRADKNDDFSADEKQRTRTLMTVFMTTVRLVVYITAIMFAVAQFDVDYGPLLVAAGGISLAVGFGAQTLVKDFFAGFFILLEGQFSIGDVVEVNGKTGTVENLNLRTTVVRSLNGDVHTIPNGQIATTTNMTKLWSRTIVDIGVAYEENTDDVCAVLDSVAREMREDENWTRKVLDHVIMGVLSMADSAVIIRVLLKTRAGEQWGASREYQRRVKLKFDELGIEIPFPQRVISEKCPKDKDKGKEDADARRKRAQVLRYVRRTRGEITEEEAALANLSVEERDRAETMARREAQLATEEAEDSGQSVQEVAAERKAEVKEDDSVSDAERLARKMATKVLEKTPPDGETADPGQVTEQDADDVADDQKKKDS
jgi:small conductance mechanosensitive channel